ncbi:5-formyltetrahydrofolate cyclo-ligase [Ectobacillus sp. JY-23]|uniref:5-formyltetrahydrofolate cyclo-ligase n=1 Tax=Ectobacillus sp. JY-23 TaxID=2933872 RepID=UPI001FF46C15|nr:5-formyltetrahydrofolate cyclo-ligase [Ectobacillus sp. JY-23]UOY94015.1 5-formyltetrahydrofolate cyclo-ligase [Ectobacillus sp. JY-23]
MKAELRKAILMELNHMTLKERTEKSLLLAQRLYQQAEWEQARTIAITISMGHEPDTRSIIEYAWHIGKKVAVPKCTPKTRDMEFRYITSFAQLETVYMELQEPMVAKTVLANPDEIELMLIPGVAFTRERARIGYGGGYYDRYLPKYKGRTVALAFAEQIVSSVPMDMHDQYVQKVITETDIFI